jgi:GTP cyclohydrolase I
MKRRSAFIDWTAVLGACKTLLVTMGEDPDRPGLRETPRRFTEAWVEYTSGYWMDPAPLLTCFEDGAENYDEMVMVKDIPVYSHCEHHLAPFFGVAHIAYVPTGRVLGLSKFARLTDIFMRRLQVQERLTQQIAHALDDALKPKGVAVMLECRHLCMEARGVRTSGSSTVTSCLLGVLKDAAPRAEFMRLVR